MRLSSYPLAKCKDLLRSFISPNKASALARQSGFVKRKPRAFTASSLLAGFMYCVSQRSVSLSNLASFSARAASATLKGTCTRQALWERFSDTSVLWSQQVLKTVVASAASRQLSPLRIAEALPALYQSFTDVILHDSTVLKLPDGFAHLYAGSFCRRHPTAQARIQTIFSVKDMAVRHFSLHGYRDNDQSAAATVLPYLRKGSLLLRDLGYFVLSSLRQIREAGAYFVSRSKSGVKFYCPKSGGELNLRALCRRASKAGGILDLEVVVGTKEQLPLRLVVTKLPRAVAAERRRKAKGDRHARANHDKAYMEALAYSFMLTNTTAEKLTAVALAKVYGIRWQIEMLFKAMKSGGAQLHTLCTQLRTNKEALQTLLYMGLSAVVMMLGVVARVVAPLYDKSKKEEGQEQGEEVSMLKALKWVWDNLTYFMGLSERQRQVELLRLCAYEKRKNRQNMIQKIMEATK